MTVPMKAAAAAASSDIMESVIAKGDLAKLTSDERVRYYNEVSRSLGLNPLTQPFAYITLNGKLTLYATRSCADQLRKINGVSLEIVSRDVADDILTVHVRARLQDGRTDEDLGSVAFAPTLKGEARANAELKAVTKAKRRATLSICGLGWLDETELADIPASAKRPPTPAPLKLASPVPHDPETGEITDPVQESGVMPHVAPDASAASVSPPEAGAVEERHPPTAEEYVTRWHAIVDRASSTAHGTQMGKQWNDEKAMRNLMIWPDDDTFTALQTKVRKAVEFLKSGAA